MKTESFPLNCIVQSATDDTGRRTLKFIRIAPDTGVGQMPVKRKPSLRLTMVAMPEAASSFAPVIQVRSPAR